MERKRDSSEENSDSSSVKKQVKLTQFFSGGKSPQASKDKQPVIPKKTPQARKLLLSTAEKWKSSSLAIYAASEWLLLNTQKVGGELVVCSMNCLFCKQFKTKINCMKQFSSQWADSGSHRVQHSAAYEHATSDAHKAAHQMYLKSKGLDAIERTDQLLGVLRNDKQQSIVEGFAAMDENTKTERKRNLRLPTSYANKNYR